MKHLFDKSILPVIIFVLSVLVSGCDSDDGDGGGSSVATVEIQQTGLVLTESGTTRQLSAVAYDAQGNPLDASFFWSSTTPADIDVDSSGKVTAMKANGSSQIIAEANGIRSAPLLAVVTLLPAGAIPLTDAQIVGDPVETDPDAEPSFDNTYRVVLSGISPPAVGALLINTESKPVAGQVVDVVDTGAGLTTVTLRLVSLREMFPYLTINENIDLSQVPVEINPDIAAAYDIQQSGNTYTFTPKPAVSHLPVASMAAALPAAAGSNNLGPFKCEADVSTIELSKPPVFSLAQNFSLELVYTPATGLERLVATGELIPRIEVNVTVSVGLGVSFECAAEVGLLRIPIVGGPLSFFVAGLVPFEVGFEGGVNQTLASVGLGVEAEASAGAEIGIACPGGMNCEFVRDVTGSADARPILNLPGLGDLRLEPSIGGFGKVKLAIGNPLFKSVRFDTFYAKSGPKLEGSFAPLVSQIDDASYRSDYKASLETKAGFTAKLGDTLKLLGLSSISALELSRSVDIAESPGGAVTADINDFVTGDRLSFHVELDPATVNFFPLLGPYNAHEILLVRDTSGNTLIVGRVSASSGQTKFDIPFTAPDSGSVSQFTAFVVTTLLPSDIFALEIGTAEGQPKGATLTAEEKYVTITDRTDGLSTISSSQTETYTVSYTLTLVQSTSNTGWQTFDFTVAGGNASYEDKYDYVEFTPGQGSGNCTYDETIEDHYVSTGSAAGAGQVELWVASDGAYDIDIMQDGQVDFTKNGVWTAHYDFTGTDNTCRTQINEPYTNTRDEYLEISSEGMSTPGQTTFSGSESSTTGNISDWGGETTMTRTWTLTLPSP